MAELTDPRRKPLPACDQPGCGAQAGDRNCYTATGWRRHPHAVRVRARDAGQMPAKPSGHLAGRRPSHKMADILAAALRDGGQFETCEWSISGASAARAAVYAMAADARGWMTKVRNTADGELYQVTDAGRAAWQRYDDWMNGRTS